MSDKTCAQIRAILRDLRSRFKEGKGAGAESAGLGGGRNTSGESCAEACEACTAQCDPSLGDVAEKKCVQACGKAYRDCMRSVNRKWAEEITAALNLPD